MTTRRTRFERRAMQEERLEKSLDGLTDAVNNLDGVNDLDEIMDGLESIEKQANRAKRQVERLASDER